jgi:hypothetical protein
VSFPAVALIGVNPGIFKDSLGVVQVDVPVDQLLSSVVRVVEVGSDGSRGQPEIQVAAFPAIGCQGRRRRQCFDFCVPVSIRKVVKAALVEARLSRSLSKDATVPGSIHARFHRRTDSVSDFVVHSVAGTASKACICANHSNATRSIREAVNVFGIQPAFFPLPSLNIVGLVFPI